MNGGGFNRFLGKVLIASHLLTFPFLTGCNKDNPASSKSDEIIRTLGSNHYGEFETLEGRTNNNGELSLTSEITGNSFDIRTIGKNGNKLSTEIRLYNDNQNNLLISSIDPTSEYLPGLYVDGNVIKIAEQNDLLDIIQSLSDFGLDEISSKFLDMPSFDENHLLNIPGIQYQGDWSFNEARNFTDILHYSSMVIIPVFPGIAPLSVATKITKEVADNVDYLIDFINYNTDLDIDKDQKFEFYSIPPLNVTFFLPKLLNEGTRNIEDYLRFEQGDWWIYTNGYNRMGVEVKGTKKINGIEVPVMRDTQGNEGYQGFDGVTFKGFGGKLKFENGDEFEFIYDPAIIIGDDRLVAGKSYITEDVTINGENSVDAYYDWERIDSIITPYGMFSNCWKIKEYSEDAHLYRWFAKNVGQVAISQGNVFLRLEDVGRGGLPDNISFSEMDSEISSVNVVNSLR